MTAKLVWWRQIFTAGGHASSIPCELLAADCAIGSWLEAMMGKAPTPHVVRNRA